MSESRRTWTSSEVTDGFRFLDQISQYRGRHDNGGTAPNSDFVADMWRVFDECGNLLLDRHADYGPTNISRSPGGPLNGLRVRIFDKIARINNLLDSGETPKSEPLRDSFLDLANYAAIALMVLDGKWPEK